MLPGELVRRGFMEQPILMRLPLFFLPLLLLALLLPANVSAANVELLNGRVKPAGHSASGRAAVVQINGGQRVLTLRSFKIDPGPKVVVWLVRRSSRSESAIRRDYIYLGKLKGSKGNQSYKIPARVDLRKYQSVVFWCVPFTLSLARADLRRS